MFYIYILQSTKDQSHYIGFTENLKSRIKQHNAGKSRYTKGHCPYILVYFEEYKLKKDAKTREIDLKKMKSIGRFLK